MRKRILPLALALTLICALAVPAMAAEKTVIETIPCAYDVIAPIGGDFVRVVVGGDERGEGGKLGYADQTGKLISPLQYYAFSDWDDYGYFFNGFEPVYQVKEGKTFCGVIDTAGREVISCSMETEGMVSYFFDGFAPWYQNGKYGFIDITGKEITPHKYDEARCAFEGLAAVKLDSGEKNEWGGTLYKWGFVDKTGREVVPCKYNEVRNFSEGLAAVKLDSGEKNSQGYPIYKWGFIDKTGEEVIPCKYDDVGDVQVEYGDQTYFNVKTFSEGLAVVYLSGKGWGAIDKTGKEIVPCKYSCMNLFSEGFAAVGMDSGEKNERGRTLYKWGFVDKTGREVVPCKYDNVCDFSEGLAAVALDSGKDQWGDPIYKWGFVDKTGKEVIPCKYYYYYNRGPSFSNGFAVILMDKGKKSQEGRIIKTPVFIDTTGEIAIDGDFDEATDFYDGFAWVRKGNKWGVIDKTGKVVLDYLYDEPADSQEIGGWYSSPQFYNGMSRVWKDGKYGLVSIVDSSRAAYASTQTVLVDGKPVEFQAYALKDANGNDTNYIKLRDVASVLNGTAVQFNVGWNGAVNIEKGKAYVSNGSEMSTPFSGNRAYETATAETRINGSPAALDAIVLKDDAGGAYTYYKLRDLGTAIGFTVGWSADKGIYIETN